MSEAEKAMLFDLAVAAAGQGSDTPAFAPLLLAFAQAYVAIRDREEGLV